MRLKLPISFLLASALASAPASRALAEEITEHAAVSTAALSQNFDFGPLSFDKTKVGRPALRGLADSIKKVWAGRHLKRGTTAIYIVDSKTGAPIYSVHENEKLNPASNVKLVSTAAVLDTLGPDWRYTTRVLGPTPREGHVAGSLYVLGTGDPTFGTMHLDDFVSQIQKAGVTHVQGDIVIGSQTIRDSVSRARIRIVAKAGRPGHPVEVSYSPESEYFKLKVSATSTKRRRSRPKIRLKLVPPEEEGGRETYQIEVSGRLGTKRTAAVWRGVSRRATFTAYTLLAKLKAAGVEVSGGVRIEELEDYLSELATSNQLPVELAQRQSSTIASLVSMVNKRSINWLADRLIMTAGAAVYGGVPTMEKGIQVMNHWMRDAGIDPSSVVVDTGSGLSYNTQISAKQIVRVLRSAAGLRSDTQSAAVFRKSLAVGGKDGTLRGRFRGSPARGRVIGKTGTLTEVIALSGFIAHKDESLCFAIVTNGNSHPNRGNVRKEHEALVELMHGFMRTNDLSGIREAAIAAAPKPAPAPAAQPTGPEVAAEDAGQPSDKPAQAEEPGVGVDADVPSVKAPSLPTVSAPL